MEDKDGASLSLLIYVPFCGILLHKYTIKCA